MADTRTTHLNLVKQDVNAAPDQEKENTNLDTLDSEIWSRGKTFNGETVGQDGGFHIRSVPYAENLDTSAAQGSEEAYIIRSTGGEASLESGDAWLTSIKGVFRRNGYVPEEISLTVSEASNPGHLSASYDRNAFVSHVSSSTTFTMVYGTGWTVSSQSVDPLNDYGITVSGEPVSGDSIYVEYVKEVLGTIVTTNPTAFVSTGWNLYDHTNARAHVIRYSNNPVIMISGAYSTIKFAPSLTTPAADRITISPVTATGGKIIAIPVGYDEGYFFITGGNNTTTAVWMTWDDWTTSYNGGVFEAYTETTINVASFISSNFPYGLLAVGTVADEINFTTKHAYSRVERKAYSQSAVDAAIAAHLQYAYDDTYLYVERETAVEFSVPDTLTGDYVANDHGLEMFSGTDVEVLAGTMYGANLRNKLERDVLTISQQTLTSDQQKQVRVNLGYNSDGILPIALGGTGAVTADAAKTALGFSTEHTTTSGKGLTMHLYKYGNIVFITVPAVQTNASVTSGTSIMTIPSGWRPANSCYCVGAHGGWDYAHHVVFEITSGGSLVCKQNLSSGTSTGLCGCYVIS